MKDQHLAAPHTTARNRLRNLGLYVESDAFTITIGDQHMNRLTLSPQDAMTLADILTSMRQKWEEQKRDE